MSKEIITVGKVDGEEWVGTSKDGVGQLLFKLQDAKQFKDGLKKSQDLAKELGCRAYQAEKENAALRESLRLKEAECEALDHDKSVLLSFVKRVSELDIEDWNYETEDGDGMCFEFIGETEIASDAVALIEDIERADNDKLGGGDD